MEANRRHLPTKTEKIKPWGLGKKSEPEKPSEENQTPSDCKLGVVNYIELLVKRCEENIQKVAEPLVKFAPKSSIDLNKQILADYNIIKWNGDKVEMHHPAWDDLEDGPEQSLADELIDLHERTKFYIDDDKAATDPGGKQIPFAYLDAETKQIYFTRAYNSSYSPSLPKEHALAFAEWLEDVFS